LPDAPLLGAVGTADSNPVRKRREECGLNQTALAVRRAMVEDRKKSISPAIMFCLFGQAMSES